MQSYSVRGKPGTSCQGEKQGGISSLLEGDEQEAQESSGSLGPGVPESARTSASGFCSVPEGGGSSNQEEDDEDGVVVGLVPIDVPKSSINPSSFGTVSEDLPDGGWKIYGFTCMHFGDSPAMCRLEVAKGKLADLGSSVDPEAAQMIRRCYVDNGVRGGSSATVDRLIGEET